MVLKTSSSRVGRIDDAVSVCVKNLHDYQLALLISRLYEGESSPTYQKILRHVMPGKSAESRRRVLTCPFFCFCMTQGNDVAAQRICAEYADGVHLPLAAETVP